MTDELPSEHWIYTICATKTHTIKTADCPWCLVAQFRGNLSLAEEGLANYAQEVERLIQSNLRFIEANKSLADDNLALRAALERIKRVGYGLELHSDPEERADYWSAMALEYRRIAADALRPAPPQSEKP